MPATKTRARSAFQASEDFGRIIVTRTGAVAPAEDDKSVDTHYVEYVNAERTIAVVSTYRNHAVAVRTDLTPEQVIPANHWLLTNDQVNDRDRGVWVLIQDDIGAKTRARSAADDLLAEVQDVMHPLTVSLDGKFSPMLTIALQKAEADLSRYGYRSTSREDDARRSALAPLAKEAGVNTMLLALAVKEDRLVWSTPPVAPKSVIVVVSETETGILSERLVDEITLASREVEGLGRIVHQGSVSEFLLVRRERHQKHDVRQILETRLNVEKALNDVKNRVDTLLSELAEGRVIGRGFHDTLNLGREVEAAQAAASLYAAAVVGADLPEAYNFSLRKNEFHDPEERYGWIGSDTRRALEALAALNGMSLKDNDY